MALLAAISLWLSLGTVAVAGGDTHRIAALPSLWILIGLAAAAAGAARAAKLRLEESWPLLVTLLLWLPFVPGRVPSAFLIWQGPTEGIVWLIAFAGLIAARPPTILPAAVDPQRAPWIAGAAAAALALVVFSGIRGVIPGGDEPHYLAATQSILKDFDLRVANNYANGDYLDYFPGRLEPHFLKRSTGGEIYSIHAPGVSVVVLPLFALLGYGGAVLTMVLSAALTAAITWHLAWRVSGSVAGAWAGVAAVFASTPYLFHAFTIYPEIIGSVCVMCGVWLLIDLADGIDVSSRSLIGSGAALAILPWLHSRFAVLAAAVGVLVVARLAPRAGAALKIAQFLAVPMVAAISWFAYFWVVWGSPNPAAPYGADTSTSASYILRGVIGLLVDQQFGLLTTAPVYLAAIGGIVLLVRRQPRLAAELFLVAVPYVLAVASYAMWWAGSAAPARFLVAILPLAALPIAMLFKARTDAASPAAVPVLTVLLLIISVALVAPRAFVESGRFIYNSRGSLDATLEWLSQTVMLPLALPSVHRDGGSIAIRDAAVWVALIVTVAALVTSLAKRAFAVRFTTAAAALGVAAMIATSTVWAFRATPAVTPDRSKLASLAAFRPAWHNHLIELSSWKRLPQSEFLQALSLDLSSPAVRVGRVPAGEYELDAAASPVPGSLALFVGRNDSPFEMPHVDDLRGGPSPLRLRLPVSLLNLNVVANDDRGAESTRLTLRPLRVTDPASPRYAVRAARYGHARTFFFDERAYPEKKGFWTRANGVATVVIDSDDATPNAGLPVSITAGLVPTTVALAVGSWGERFELVAGQKHDVMLPPAAGGVWVLSIRSGNGFRPSEREPGSTDVRSLAAWVAVH